MARLKINSMLRAVRVKPEGMAVELGSLAYTVKHGIEAVRNRVQVSGEPRENRNW